MKSYAILTDDGWYTPYRKCMTDGPPLLYKTRKVPERNIEEAKRLQDKVRWVSGRTGYYGIATGTVVEVQWRALT